MDLAEIGFKANTSGIDTADRKLNALAVSGGKVDSTFMSLSKTIGVVASTLAVAGISNSVIASHVRFTTALSQLSAITGATGKDLEYYREQSLAIGASTTLSASQAASAFKLIASAKPDLLASAESLAAVTQQAVYLAEAAGIDMPQAAKSLGSALNQFQLDANKSSDVINILAASSKYGTSSIAEVSDALVNAGSAANSLGVNLTDTVTGIQLLAKAGITAAEGGTGLRQVMLRLENTNNTALMPSVSGLSSSLQTLSDMQLSNTQLMKMFGIEAFKSVTALLAQQSSFDKLSQSITGTNVAYEQAGINNDNLEGDYKKLKSVVESLSLSIGEDLDGSMRSAVQGTTSLLSNIDALENAGIALVSVVGVGLTPAIGAYTVSLYATTSAQLLAGTTAVKTANAFGMVTTTAATATVATNALGIATRFLLGPWGLLLTAIGTAAAVFISSKNAAEELNDSLEEQKLRVEGLDKAYANLTKSQIGTNASALLLEMNKLEQDRLDILEKINKYSNSNRGGAHMSAGLVDADLSGELDAIDAALAKSTEKYDSLIKALNKPLESGWIDATEKTVKVTAKAKSEYDKYLKTITSFQTPLDVVTGKIAKFREAVFSGDVKMDGAASNYIASLTTELEELNGVADTKSGYQDWLDNVIASSKSGQLEAIAGEIKLVKSSMSMGDIDTSTGTAYLDELQKRAEELKGTLSGVDLFNGVANGAKSALTSIQGLSEQGSKEYQQLGVAVQALTAAQAINAVVNQAAGTNPYESFTKMAAMASALGALGVSVGGMSGGFSDSSADNQESQGLNVWGDKSESISNGIDSIESSNSDLVSINSGMLSALESLSIGISAASAQSLQGYTAQSLDVSGELYNNEIESYLSTAMSGAMSSMTLGLSLLVPDMFSSITSKISGWIGGSSKNTDSGFQIAGGSLGDLSESANVDAYSETQYKKWKYGSTKTKTDYQDLDEASAQFALVFDSLATSVYEGAISLGMSADDAEQAINDYYIATTKISLKGLSAEAQAAEIESVFSSIFDGVAGSVIPYLDEFQQVGEGLGDTLSRLSTEVSLVEAYSDILGFTLSDKLADPYLYATISDNLATLTGGLEGFATATASFVDSFANDDIKLGIATDTMEAALSALGLSLPSTTDGFYELMQGLDASTESGQAQIAGLLNLTDTASNYYSLLDGTVGDFNDSLSGVSESLLDAIDSMYGVTEEQAAQSLNDALLLARAGSYDAALNLDTSSLAPTTSSFSNSTEFAIAQANTANKMAELAALTGQEKTTAEYQLSQSIEQTTLLSELKEQQLKTDKTLALMATFAKETKDTLLSFSLDSMNVRVVS